MSDESDKCRYAWIGKRNGNKRLTVYLPILPTKKSELENHIEGISGVMRTDVRAATTAPTRQQFQRYFDTRPSFRHGPLARNKHVRNKQSYFLRSHD